MDLIFKKSDFVEILEFRTVSLGANAVIRIL